MTQPPASAASAVDPTELEALIERHAPARVYDLNQITELQQVGSGIECECPNQIAALIEALRGFEDYSAACENKDDEDAEIHAMLYRATGQARAVLEVATQRLCRFEGLDIASMADTPPQP